MRILLVSQMYPGPDDPDLGVFVRDLEVALAGRGHEIDGAGLAVRAVCARADAVIAVSQWLRGQLEARVPAVRGKVEVIDCGVDCERFRPDAAVEPAVSEALGPRPAYLCVGSLTERKN